MFDNPHIRSLDPDFFRWAFTETYAAYWAPLTWLSYAVDYSAWGTSDFGYHLTNTVLHSANSAIVALIAARVLSLAGERSSASPLADRSNVLLGAGAAGILFAVHPLRVESVAWIAERKGLLSGLFYLLAVLVYLGRTDRSAAEPSPWIRRWSRQLLAPFVLFAASLLAKPVAVTLPLVLLVLDAYPARRIRSLGTLLAATVEKLPYFLGSAFSVLMSVRAARAAGPMLTLDDLPMSTRVLVAAHSLVAYVGKMVWPGHLVPFYPYPQDVRLFSAEYLLPLAIVIGISAACIWTAGRPAGWSAAWLAYVATLLPVAGLAQAGAQSMADRFTYLPAVVLSILAGAGIAWSWSWASGLGRAGAAVKATVAAVLVFVGVLLSILTVSQNAVWKDDLTFWSCIIDREPTVYFAYSNRAMLYRRMGETAKALRDLDRALSLSQDDDVPFLNRALLLIQVGEVARGVEDLRRACQLGNSFACASARWQVPAGP